METLDNTKVYVRDKSKEIQEKLFSLGYRWIGCDDCIIINLNHPFIFIYEDKTITATSDVQRFFNHIIKKEVTPEEILNFKPIQKVKLEPFQKVLVRDSNTQRWCANFFSNTIPYLKIYKYQCLDNVFSMCIPYEGNEHLLGTTEDIEIEIINK